METIKHLNGFSPSLEIQYTKGKFVLFILLLSILSLTITGCVALNDPESSQEYFSDTIGTLDNNTTIGQTFISRRPNLNGMMIWITVPPFQANSTTQPSPNNININLFHSLGDSQPIFSNSIRAPIAGNIVPVTINIPNQENLAGEAFYITFSTDRSSFEIKGRSEDAYPFGEALINGIPKDADIGFRSSYEYDLSGVIQDITYFLMNIRLGIPLLISLLLPGWLLLEFSKLRHRFDFGEQIALSVGISLGIIPIVMLWTTKLNIKWTNEGTIFIALCLVAILISRLIYVYMDSRRTPKTVIDLSDQKYTGTEIQHSKRWIIAVSLILIFLGTLAVRLIMVRDLATPAWVDSVHHALITSMILDQGSYPTNYLPYWDIDPTAYHPGFHSVAAVFTWLSNLSIERSLLILGQVINATAIFSIYLFTKTLTQSPIAGLFAAVITGFLTPMPAYYTTWGRYTELTGLLILPAAFALFCLLMIGEKAGNRNWVIFLCAITSSGLFLVHYRVTIFLGFLILIYYLSNLLVNSRKTPRKHGGILIFITVTGILSILFVYPWFISTIRNIVVPMLGPARDGSSQIFQDFPWAYLTSAMGKQALVLAVLGLLWGLINQKRFAFLLFVWILMLFLIVLVDQLYISGGGLITNLSVEIMLFVPISVLGGYFLYQIFVNWESIIPNKFRIPYMIFIGVLTILLCYTGSKQLVNILNPITILSRNADIPAIAWVRENIPENETVLINPFAWGYGLYAGSDGGYWISPLAGQITMPPPVLYGLGSGRKQINGLSENVIKYSSNPKVFWEYLKSNQVNYVFIGAKGGILSPDKLSESELFNIRYHKDGVWIFSLKP